MILYHGTGFTFDRFKPNSFFTDSYDIAAQYAAIRFGDEAYIRVIQVEVKASKLLHIPAECLYMLQMREAGNVSYMASDADIAYWLENTEADVAVIHGLQDLGGTPTQYVVKDPGAITFLAETVGTRSWPGCECKYLEPVDNCDVPF